MDKYDPQHAPIAAEWLELDEQLRIMLCEEHHRRSGHTSDNVQGHALFHAIVENQIAENYGPAVRALSRLIDEGLSRHDAIHAVASVLAEYVFELMNAGAASAPEAKRAEYEAALERLNKKRWLDG